MDQETDKIKQHIDNERQRLGEDLHEIEDRVKSAADWRTWFDKNPGLVLGAAVAGGFLTSLLIGKITSGETGAGNYVPEIKRKAATLFGSGSSTSTQMQRVAEAIDNTFAALVGVASSKLHDFVADAVPGFREHYEQVDKNSFRSSGSRIDRAEEGQMSAD